MSSDMMKNCKPALSYRSTSLFDPVILRIGDGDRQPITVPQLFDQILETYSHRPALRSQDSDKKWITQTYKDYWNNSRLIAKGFIRLGLKPRTSCGILAISSPEWFITQMATIFAGGVSAGIYLSNSADAVYHILHKSNATICVVDNSAQMAKVKSIRHRLPQMKSIIQIEAPFEDFIDSEEGYYSWSYLKKVGASESKLKDELAKRLESVVANECITLIFTSGTVGMPKGVMLSHDNLISSANKVMGGMSEVTPGEEVLVSYLPMNHISGQLLDFFISLSTASCVYFADRNALKGTLLDTIAEVQPTRIFGVPRVFEKMRDKFLENEQNMSWMEKLVFDTARRGVSNHIYASMMSESKAINSLGYWLGLKVIRKYKMALGLGRCKSVFTGAAPSANGLKNFFMGYDIKLSEMYGLSETSGPTNACWNLEDLDSCGKALTGVEQRLTNVDELGHGEICTRSRIVFMGYLQEPEKTEETFSEDGWMHTGDIGYFDSKQRLCISGRLKELIVTSGGENIPPIHIERLVLHELPGLSNAILVGDKRKFLTMLVTIKTDIDPKSGKPGDNLQAESIEWMKSLALPCVKLSQILDAGPCPKVLQSIQEGIDRANAKAISNAQRVQKFSILPHDFSIPTGELGPTLKLRRNIVLHKYADIIEDFYRNS